MMSFLFKSYVVPFLSRKPGTTPVQVTGTYSSTVLAVRLNPLVRKCLRLIDPHPRPKRDTVCETSLQSLLEVPTPNQSYTHSTLGIFSKVVSRPRSHSATISTSFYHSCVNVWKNVFDSFCWIPPSSFVHSRCQSFDCHRARHNSWLDSIQKWLLVCLHIISTKHQMFPLQEPYSDEVWEAYREWWDELQRRPACATHLASGTAGDRISGKWLFAEVWRKRRRVSARRHWYIRSKSLFGIGLSKSCRNMMTFSRSRKKSAVQWFFRHVLSLDLKLIWLLELLL